MKRTLFFSVFALGFFLIYAYPLYADMPKLISYQGRVTDSNGSPLADNDYDMTFKIYNVETGGSPLWTETWNVANQVTVTNGLFSVLLGSITTINLSFDVQYWLDITVNSETFSPRQKLTTASYAFNANDCDGDSTCEVQQIDSGQGSTEVYLMDQNIRSTDAVTFVTVDTGQGAYELQDSSTSNKGLASFSSTNFSASSGAISIKSGGVGATELASTTVTAAGYGSATQVGTFTVDADGRLTAAGNTTISGVPPGGSAGGDLSGSYPNPTVAKINGVTLGTTTATDANILVADGTDWDSVAMSGDVNISNTGATTIQANAVALGTDTTGNYAGSTSESGPATDLSCTDCLNATEIEDIYLLNSGDTMTNTLTFSGVATDITTGANEHLALMPNGTGNVGIGTASPDTLVDIETSGTPIMTVQTSATSSQDAIIRIRGARTTSSTSDIAQLEFYNDESGGAFQMAEISSRNADDTSGTTYSDLLFWVNNGTALTEAMRIDDTGNLGIGTGSPGALLHVGSGGTLDNVGANDVYIQNDLEVDGTIYGAISGSMSGTLTRGTGLSGNNYNGSADTTWAVVYGTNAGNAVQGNQTASITAGSGLTGGISSDALGDGFSATLTVGAGTGITVNANDIEVNYGTSAGNAVEGNQTASISAGNGLTGGISSDALGNGFTATLTVGAGTGISVAADSVSVDQTWTDGLYINDDGDTMAGTLNMNNNLITNIGNANTDFTSGGGLNIAGNVGIGHITPRSDLDVDGHAFATRTGTDSGVSGTSKAYLEARIPIPSIKTAGEIGISVDASQDINDNVAGERDAAGVGCQSLKTYAEAQAIAEGVGARLPTIEEVEGGVAHGTGCSFDNYYVWSQTKCATSGTGTSVLNYYWISPGNPANLASYSRYCVAENSTAPPAGHASAYDEIAVEWAAEVSKAYLPVITDSSGRLRSSNIRARTSTGLTIDDDGGTLGIFIEDGGNVGIGTTGPSALLHVGSGGTPGDVGANDAYIQNDLEVDGTIYASISGSMSGTLTRGTGLSGNNYNGSANTTWAVVYGTSSGEAVQGNQTATITAGNGLTGGISSDALGDGFTASLAVGAGTGITVNADDIAVNYGTTSGTAVQGNQTANITAGNGLTGGISSDALGDGFSASLAVGAGTGISVAADSVAVDQTWTDGLYINDDGDTMTGSLHINVADSIFFESDNHAITYNDGSGNFNIRVGNTEQGSGERCTEAGYVSHMEWSQSGGWWQVNFDNTSLAVGNTPTWDHTLQFTKDGALSTTGNLTVSGTGDSSFAGKVGIGITNPSYKLDVSGSGHFTGDLTVDGTITGTIAGDADTVDGYHASTTRDSANTIPVRDASGYLQLGWINTTSGDRGTTAPTRIYASDDAYIRYYTPANFATVMKANQQKRVTGTCAAGNSIRVIADDGTVTCEADTDTDTWITTQTCGTDYALQSVGKTSKTCINKVDYSDIAYDLSCTDCIGTTEIADSYVLNSGDTMTGQLNMHTGSYEGSITLGSSSTWRTGIRQHDDNRAELRIWAKNTSGMIFLATGYDGEPADIARPTDGLVVYNNRVGIGNFSATDPDDKLDVEGDIRINDNKLALRTGTDDNHYIQWVTGVDGPRIAGYGGIEFYKTNGSVQLGTWDSSKLYVNGNISLSGEIQDGKVCHPKNYDKSGRIYCPSGYIVASVTNGTTGCTGNAASMGSPPEDGCMMCCRTSAGDTW